MHKWAGSWDVIRDYLIDVGKYWEIHQAIRQIISSSILEVVLVPISFGISIAVLTTLLVAFNNVRGIRGWEEGIGFIWKKLQAASPLLIINSMHLSK